MYKSKRFGVCDVLIDSGEAVIRESAEYCTMDARITSRTRWSNMRERNIS